MITLGIWLAERGMLPDFILRVAVKFLSKARVRMPNVFSEKLKVLNTLKEGPIAESTSSANEQHYEVPPIFFEKVLGENLKYSCCLYNENNKDLNSAEIFMLDKYLDRADIKSNQEILDLGCGWGSFTLHAAKKFPQSNFTSISNSKDQIDFINARATALNLTNVKAIRQNINELNLDKKFDRIVSIEMFEHMRNYKKLMKQISDLLVEDGKLFVHIFCHKNSTYLYEAKSDSDWMSKFFFTGGIMPSQDIFNYFNEDLVLKNSWEINGKHYSKTSKDWLKNMDRNKNEIKKILNDHYDEKNIWFYRWRIFFLTCEEFFKINKGKEWFVSHYLLTKKNN